MSEPAERFISSCVASPEFQREMEKFEKENGRPNMVYAVAMSERGDGSVMKRLLRFFEKNKGKSE